MFVTHSIYLEKASYKCLEKLCTSFRWFTPTAIKMLSLHKCRKGQCSGNGISCKLEWQSQRYWRQRQREGERGRFLAHGTPIFGDEAAAVNQNITVHKICPNYQNVNRGKKVQLRPKLFALKCLYGNVCGNSTKQWATDLCVK